MAASGPLVGVRVVELAGIGPAPFAATLLSDLGAEVIRVDRPSGTPTNPPTSPMRRGRRSIAVDLKQPDGVALVLRLADHADALIEPWRPGVAERLGLGPDECVARNERLVYGRVTGWGQDGPLAGHAGHDINYIALAGALYQFGREGQPPTVPMNLVGDYGGGGMLLAFGLVCALFEARSSGRGQVVDAAMVDGTAALMGTVFTLLASGQLPTERGTGSFDTGAPFYDTYETADGRYLSIGSIEPQFYANLLRITGIRHDDLPSQHDRSGWPRLRARLAEAISTRTLDEWCVELADERDLCWAPVLRVDEAARHPHNAARGTFVEIDGVLQAAPVPRFSRTPGAITRPPAAAGEHSAEILTDWLGATEDKISRWSASGAIA